MGALARNGLRSMFPLHQLRIKKFFDSVKMLWALKRMSQKIFNDILFYNKSPNQKKQNY